MLYKERVISTEYVIQLRKQLHENQLYQNIQQYLENELSLETQMIEAPKGMFLQVREKKKWKKYTGMGVALSVKLSASSDLLVVEFVESKWLDKAAAEAAGLFLFAPLFVTGAIGIYRQSNLHKKILKVINTYVETNEADIHKCADLDFSRKCSHCGAIVESDSEFCNECGGKINA